MEQLAIRARSQNRTLEQRLRFRTRDSVKAPAAMCLRSKLHGRGVFADTNFKRDEIVELGA